VAFDKEGQKCARNVERKYITAFILDEIRGRCDLGYGLLILEMTETFPKTRSRTQSPVDEAGQWVTTKKVANSHSGGLGTGMGVKKKKKCAVGQHSVPKCLRSGVGNRE